jgi:transaldolase
VTACAAATSKPSCATSNPSIFQKALADGAAYDAQVRDLALRGVDIGEAVRDLTAYDVRWACDVLRPVYDASGTVDGRVSIEVDPRISGDAARTIAEAKALWWLVDRPNLFIKIPATLEGLPAITATLAAGISVNVTLIFSLHRYDAVMDAFLSGLEQAQANGHDLSVIGSVASFFVSRVDTEIDKRLGDGHALRGKAAIANARLAYERYEQVVASDRWKALAAAGAKPQRPLWASTGVKDPAYDDTQYVVELVAPGTVNTMPEATLDAVADHGTVRWDTVTGAYGDAQQVLDDLAAAGIDYDDVVDLLEREGVDKFEVSWNDLIASVTDQLKKAGADPAGGSDPAGDGPAAAAR